MHWTEHPKVAECINRLMANGVNAPDIQLLNDAVYDCGKVAGLLMAKEVNPDVLLAGMQEEFAALDAKEIQMLVRELVKRQSLAIKAHL